MRLSFCDYHICTILGRTNPEKPLDLFLSDYFRSHKSIGAKDRRTIGKTLYEMTRWKSLIDHFCPPYCSAEKRLEVFQQISIESCFKDSSIPKPARFGVSPFLFQKFCSFLGEKKAEELCLTLNTEAPTTIRVNTLKISRSELLKKWEGKFEMIPCAKSQTGIQFLRREPLFSLEEFKEGLFEVQDEASQLVAELIEIQPKEQILDYCAGSGGKTLAFAPKMKGSGQIYLYDKRSYVLLQARKRLRRAGIQNAQFCLPKKKVDWLVLDVPCSGTGTLRRNPDAKWKIDQPMIDRLVQEQREIAKEALRFLKPNAKLVYITCSLLPEENEHQVDFFLKTLPLKLEKTICLYPEKGGADGFFAAVFTHSLEL